MAADSWTPLFDGKSLAGWRWDKPGESNVPSWEARDGMLCTTPGQGKAVYLISEREFEDFELRFEWRTENGGNSGIKYRVQTWGNSERRLEPSGLEYQITDDVDNRDAKSATKHTSGAIYDYVAPEKSNPARADVWHRAGIVVKGTKIEHWLDGERTVALDLATEQAKLAFATSKRGSREMLRKQEQRKSPIALQIHDGVVCFRELKVKPL
ncbi:MAG: DUF1080 domain-containing protein [Bryobacter sp.]